MGAVRKARAAIKAAKGYQPHPLPEGLRHLFQPYIPTPPGTKTRRRGPVQLAPQLPVGKDLMEALIEHQGGICPACDDWLEMDPDFGISHPLKPSFDHVMPRSRGGSSVGNKLAMHRECNCAKGNRLPTGCERIWLTAVNARLGL